jgi:methyltransferase (TIGR00027 family)
MSPAPIRDVSDTARWVAYFRALESERHDALFRDRYARRLAGERGRAIAEGLPSGPLRWSLAVRTRVFDEMILASVRSSDITTVLNLAAGLDARPYRLELPETLRWIEVDLPSIIEWKERVLRDERPACTIERFSLDLSDPKARRDLWARVRSEGRPVLVITEGLLAYLDEASVASLADEIHSFLPTSQWLLENVAPSILTQAQRNWGKALRPAKAEMKFAPPEGLEFFRRHGWVATMTKSLLDEAERLGREMPMIAVARRVFSFIPPLKRAYEKRQQRFRGAVVYALMERVPL